MILYSQVSRSIDGLPLVATMDTPPDVADLIPLLKPLLRLVTLNQLPLDATVFLDDFAIQ